MLLRVRGVISSSKWCKNMKKIALWLYLCFSGLLFAEPMPPTASSATETMTDNSELFSIDGYRLFHYRSPTPEQHEQATTLSTAQLVSLLKTSPKPALLDVQPLLWRAGFFIQTSPRQHIPGSLWTPNVGQGELNDVWSNYFADGLQKITQGNKAYPLVIYCTADCWMSWNAVKRAGEWGYTQLYWYRDGSDGWQEADLPTTIGQPESLPAK